MQFELGTDGLGARTLDLAHQRAIGHPRNAGIGSRDDRQEWPVRRGDDMHMDGAATFMFTLKMVPKAVGNLLTKAGLTVDDVDLFIFHQASEMIIESSAKKPKIPREKLHYKLHDVGNSGGSTVAVALHRRLARRPLRPGMRVVLAAFGVGLSWASASRFGPKIRWARPGHVDFAGSPPRPANQQIG